MATRSTASTAANARSVEGNIDSEVAPQLFHVEEPTSFPLFTLLGGYMYGPDKSSKPEDVKGLITKEQVATPDYSVIEKDPYSRTVTVNGAVADTTTTTVTLDSNTVLRQGDYLYNKSTKEHMYVYAVDAGGTDISVRRNLGDTEYTIGDNDILHVSSCGFRESSAKASIKAHDAEKRTRYTQIFKRAFGVSGTLMESLQYTTEIEAWDEEMFQSAYNHKLDIENHAWMSPATDSTTDSTGTVYNSRGILAELGPERTSYYSGSLDEDSLFGHIANEVYEYGSRKKTWFVNAEFINFVHKLGRSKLDVTTKDTIYGLQFSEINLGVGTAQLVNCGVFDKHLPSGTGPFAVALDLQNIRYKYMRNRDSKLMVDIQTPGTDAKEGQYFTESGFSVRQLPTHRIIAPEGF